jgi:hypothetical protein
LQTKGLLEVFGGKALLFLFLFAGYCAALQPLHCAFRWILRGFTAKKLCDPRSGAVDSWLLRRLAVALLRVSLDIARLYSRSIARFDFFDFAVKILLVL